MRKCQFCHEAIDDTAWVCPHCGKELIATVPTPASAAPAVDMWVPQRIPEPPAPSRVAVVDINMPFGSMVGFMIKWALAAIPAFLILAVIGFLLSALFAGLVAGLFRQ